MLIAGLKILSLFVSTDLTMAGDFVPEAETGFKGFKRQFNGLTVRGRRNVRFQH